MTRRHLLAGLAIAALSVGAALAQTTVDGLDLEAIDKRAKAGAADLSQFVDQVLHTQGKANAEQRASIENMVATATSKVASVKAVPDAGISDGVDLDGLVAQAGQAVKPDTHAAPMFIAFASLSMPEDSLKRLIADVTRAGGMVVFRGFSASGGRAFMDQLRKVVSQGDAARISIDPRLFAAYRIDAVPTYVAASTSFELCSGPDCISAPTPFDRLAGNVTTRFALETIVDGHGPGAPVATRALANLDAAP